MNWSACCHVPVVGSKALEGKRIGERPGHIKDNPNFDSKRIFVSTSIKYAGLHFYATPER